ncbi:hypothetical protein ACPXCS_36600 [Streptomyces sp. DT190]|uniref:hypothetical protein n=1 Tax=Streptomyces sp. DT190 TaxID=3416527 RepID=UPI003CF13A63
MIDAGSWLNYKPVMAEAGRSDSRAFPELAKAGVPPQELRRLAAYKVLASYDNNQAGQLAAVGGDTGALERRELGDAAKLFPVDLVLRTPKPSRAALAGSRMFSEATPCPLPFRPPSPSSVTFASARSILPTGGSPARSHATTTCT